MLDSAVLMAFVPSTDLDRARTFYHGVLGLAAEEINSYACVLRSGGMMLRITKVDEFVPQPFTVLGWTVADVRQAVSGLAAKGVVFERFDGMDQDASGVWSTPGGDKVAWFKDPDGNTLSLTQFVHR
jgi:predicted enzyme related to lactoylglutathione lyase